MSNFRCGSCGKKVKALVNETTLPLEIKNYNIYRFFVLSGFCKSCQRQKAVKRGLTRTGKYIDFGNIKSDKIDKYLQYSKNSQKELPKIAKESIDSSRFYLNFNEYGKKKKCFSNLSTLKLGILKTNFEDLIVPFCF